MGKIKIEGSFVALMTPFNRDGTIDYEAFKTLIDFQTVNGTSALLIMGSTGEVSMLSKKEKQEIISKTIKFKKGNLSIYYGCTGTTTQDTSEMVHYAGDQGADGAIITIPPYIHPPEEDAIQYFLDVADDSKIPIGIYNNPTRVGTDLSAKAIIRLADHPNIVIDKEAMPRAGQIAEILASKKKISLMCCDSPDYGLVMPVMSLGGQGTANVTGNIAPQEMAIISKPWKSYEDSINCRSEYLRIFPLFKFLYSKVNPIPVKSLAKALGLPVGILRKPYQNLTGEALEIGVKIVKKLGLAEKYQYSNL